MGATAAAQVKGEGRDRSLQREQRSLSQGLQWEKRKGGKGRESERTGEKIEERGKGGRGKGEKERREEGERERMKERKKK